MMKNEDENLTLTNSKILNVFISSLKSAHKAQGLKKKNNKKLMNLFSVKVQKYEDSSSHYKTDGRSSRVSREHQTKSWRKKNFKLPIKKDKKVEYSLKKLDYESREYEYNSDSSIYTQHENPGFHVSEQVTEKYEKKNFSSSLSKNMRANASNLSKNERYKIIKHNFNKQIDLNKKFLKEDLTGLAGNNNVNNHFDSIKDSFGSLNGNETQKTNSKNYFNYYFIKNLNENKDLIQYDKEDSGDNKEMQYDENYKCYYSLDHKSKIIYIKPSPKLLSTMTSYFNSKLASKQATNNISNSQSNMDHTPNKKENNGFDHNSFLEKLKTLEIKQKEQEFNSPLTPLTSSEGEEEDEGEFS